MSTCKATHTKKQKYKVEKECTPVEVIFLLLEPKLSPKIYARFLLLPVDDIIDKDTISYIAQHWKQINHVWPFHSPDQLLQISRRQPPEPAFKCWKHICRKNFCPLKMKLYIDYLNNSLQITGENHEPYLIAVVTCRISTCFTPYKRQNLSISASVMVLILRLTCKNMFKAAQKSVFRQWLYNLGLFRNSPLHIKDSLIASRYILGMKL